MNNEERYKLALEEIAKGNDHVLVGNCLCDIQMANIAKNALTPPKEYVEEEVVGWYCPNCHMYGTPIDVDDKVCGNCSKVGLVRLTGTRKIKVEPKVTRRVEAEKYMSSDNVHYYFGVKGLEKTSTPKKLILEWLE